MTQPHRRDAGLAATELIEEAVHLLRLSPPGVFARYYVGAVPFVLGLLYFWSDMSRSAFAADRCAPASLGLALLYLWMKCWQTVFVRELRARITWRASPPWTWRQAARLVLAQTVLQPTSLFLLPVALLITLPLGWAYAFYQNLSVLGDGTTGDLRAVQARARVLALTWPRQNHVVILVLGMFGLFVFLNLAVALYWLPPLARSLFGVQTALTENNWAWLNSTFLAATFSLTYLCVGPLIKAVYTLRCFYGESVQSGQDLIVGLAHLAPWRAGVWLALLLACGAGTAPAAAAGSPAAPGPPAAAVSGAELDRSLGVVIQQGQYAWRMPRERPAETDSAKSPFALFLEGVADTVWGGMRKLAGAVRRAFEWMMEHWFKRRMPAPASEGSGIAWLESLYAALWVLLAVLAGAIAVLALRWWRQPRSRRVEVSATATRPTPDLEDEHLAADQLPAEDWFELARKLTARGDLRLAVRALYLASLSRLARDELLALARFKSNRDYELELQRRAHSQPELVGAFAQNVRVFDRVWYGRHEVNSELLGQFSANVEKIKNCGAQ